MSYKTTFPFLPPSMFRDTKLGTLLPRQPIDHYNLPTIASSVYPIFFTVKFDDQTRVTGAEIGDKT